MPSRKEIQWSQLKVGALVLVALAVLTAIIFLMTGILGRPVRSPHRSCVVTFPTPAA